MEINTSTSKTGTPSSVHSCPTICRLRVSSLFAVSPPPQKLQPPTLPSVPRTNCTQAQHCRVWGPGCVKSPIDPPASYLADVCSAEPRPLCTTGVLALCFLSQLGVLKEPLTPRVSQVQPADLLTSALASCYMYSFEHQQTVIHLIGFPHFFSLSPQG